MSATDPSNPPATRRRALLAAFLALAASCGSTRVAVPDAPPTRTEHTMSREVDGRRLSYLLDVPTGEAPRRGRPLVLFLHGIGERGDDLARVAVHGPPKLAPTMPELWGCVLVSPQCPDDTWWPTETLVALVEEVCDTCEVDRDRVYVTGLSMGGFGTWELLATHPDLFAAAAPICGGMREDRESAIVAAKDVPIRVFHGADDRLVPVEMSERLVERLRDAGADVELTVYEGVGHDAWTRTYSDPELWTWMFAQER
ncbi:MAG: prolyl oligopeptidase family serine peptidase [Planctomycetota bacterium]